MPFEQILPGRKKQLTVYADLLWSRLYDVVLSQVSRPYQSPTDSLFWCFFSGRGCRKVLSNTDDTFYILLPLHRVGVILFKCDKVKGKLAIYSNEDTNRQERNQNKKNLNGQLFLHNHTEDRFTGFGRRH